MQGSEKTAKHEQLSHNGNESWEGENLMYEEGKQGTAVNITVL